MHPHSLWPAHDQRECAGDAGGCRARMACLELASVRFETLLSLFFFPLLLTQPASADGRPATRCRDAQPAGTADHAC